MALTLKSCLSRGKKMDRQIDIMKMSNVISVIKCTEKFLWELFLRKRVLIWMQNLESLKGTGHRSGLLRYKLVEETVQTER